MSRLLAMMLTLAWTGAAAAQVKSVELVTSRDFGHFVGDILHSEADVTVDPGYALVEASAPRRGAVNQWLEIVAVRIERDTSEDASLYRIFLDYQTIYPALDARRIAVPGFEVSFASKDHRTVAKVPAWSFLISPLREVLPAEKADGEAYMAPDSAPRPYDLGPATRVLLASLALFLALLALLAHRLAWWPFLAPKKRPFVRAARQVGRLLDGAQDAAAYRQSLQIVHRAIDETAGRAILGDDVTAFLRDAPAFSRLRDDFASFFRSSRHVFFADTATSSFGARELRRFCDELAATERLAR